MKIFSHSIPSLPSWISKNQFFAKFTKEQKIALIALAVFSCCCGIFFAVRRCLSRKVVSVDAPIVAKNHWNGTPKSLQGSQDLSDMNLQKTDELKIKTDELLKSSAELLKKTEERLKATKILIKKIDPKSSMNDIVMHLMMDKLFVAEQNYEGSLDIIAVQSIKQALEQLEKNLSDWEMDQESKRCLVELNNHLYPLFESYQEFVRLSMGSRFSKLPNKLEGLKIAENALSPEEYDKIYLEKIMSSIKKLGIGEGVLMHLGCQFHATDLFIQRTDDALFRLTHYNTGYGIDFHYRYQNTHLYQTYDVIEDVPADSVLDEEKWKAHFFDLQDNKKMDAAYEWIRNEIGRGGTRLSASEHIEDYEATQFSGTCATQSKMALLRHQCMQIAQGTPSEKEACYKVIKSCLFLQYLKDHTDEFEEEIRKYLPSVKEKLAAEQTLRQIANDDQQMVEALTRLNNVLIKLDENGEIAVLPNDASFLTRYAFLRRASTFIYKKLLDRSDHDFANALQHPALRLVAAKLNHFGCVEKNLRSYLKGNNGTDQSILIDRLYFTLVNTPHTAVVMEEVVEILGEESPQVQPSPIIKGLFEKLNQSRELNESLVNQLSESIKNRGNVDLSNWMLDYWETLKNTPVSILQV